MPEPAAGPVAPVDAVSPADAQEPDAEEPAGLRVEPSRTRRFLSALVVPVLVGLVALAVSGSVGLRLIEEGRSRSAPETPEATRPAATAVIGTIAVGANPQDLAFDAGRLVVTRLGEAPQQDQDGDDPARRGHLLVIDPATRAVTRTITVDRDPMGVAIDPARSVAWVANSGARTVTAVDLASGRAVAEIETGVGPRGVGVHPASGLVYVANTGEDSMAVIDPQSMHVLDVMGVPARPLGVAFEETDGLVLVTKSEAAGVEVIDPTQMQGDFTTGERPFGLAMDHALGAVYVTNWGGNSVTVAEAKTRRWWDTILVGQRPYGVAIDEAARVLYVTNWDSSSVSVIDANTRTVVNEIQVGAKPQGIAVDQETGTVYVVNSGDGLVSILGQG